MLLTKRKFQPEEEDESMYRKGNIWYSPLRNFIRTHTLSRGSLLRIEDGEKGVIFGYVKEPISTLNDEDSSNCSLLTVADGLGEIVVVMSDHILIDPIVQKKVDDILQPTNQIILKGHFARVQWEQVWKTVFVAEYIADPEGWLGLYLSEPFIRYLALRNI